MAVAAAASAGGGGFGTGGLGGDHCPHCPERVEGPIDYRLCRHYIGILDGIEPVLQASRI